MPQRVFPYQAPAAALIVVEPDPIRDNPAGVLQGFEAMAVRALGQQLERHTAEHDQHNNSAEPYWP
jgi:hypothetical protein